MANKLALDKLAAGAAQSIQMLLAAQQQRQIEEMKALAALKKMLTEQQFEAQQKAQDRALQYEIAKKDWETRREIAAGKNQIELEKLKEMRRRNQMLEQLRRESNKYRAQTDEYQRALDTIDLLIKAKRNNINLGSGVPSPDQLIGGVSPVNQPQQGDPTKLYLQMLLQQQFEKLGLPMPTVEQQQQLPPGAIPFSIYDPRTMQLIINQNKQGGGKTAPRKKEDPFAKEIEALGGEIIE